jgi:uroporphyrin-3 C-methyltransferase/uroporphyrinogen III methyltransferase/synthase
MNDMPNSPDTPLPSGSAAPISDAAFAANPDSPKKGRLLSRPRPVAIALIVLVILLVAQWFVLNKEISALRSEVAKRMQSGDNINTETRVIAKTIQETTQELQAKVSVLESKQTEAQSQQLALEQLYQDLFKKREDWALAEIEQVLSTASQQLQLAGNVQGALIALQNADARLARSETPQFVVVRRAIGHDIERLKALPSLDLTGITLRLDSVIGQIDNMPLLSDEQPLVPVSEPKVVRHEPARAKVQKDKQLTVKEAPQPSNEWLPIAKVKFESWTNEMWTDIQQLIRIRKVGTPDALLLSPTQAYYARENLKLRLLTARLSLLSRNEDAFRSDMIAAQDTIAKYFDTRARQTQTAQTILKQVQASNLAIEMPTLAESLNAVRNYKPKP